MHGRAGGDAYKDAPHDKGPTRPANTERERSGIWCNIQVRSRNQIEGIIANSRARIENPEDASRTSRPWR